MNAGDPLGRCEILSAIGAVGMGEAIAGPLSSTGRRD